jgi:hypothetical protein
VSARASRWSGFCTLAGLSIALSLLILAGRKLPRYYAPGYRGWPNINHSTIRTETDDAHQRVFAKSAKADRKVVDRVAEVAAARGVGSRTSRELTCYRVMGGDRFRRRPVQVRTRLSAGGEWIRTSSSGASGEADAFLPVKDRPR